MNKTKLTWKNCIKCKEHITIKDPDPDSYYLSPDVAVLCTLTPNDLQDEGSDYVSDRSDFKAVVKSCRPTEVDKKSIIPEWCPLR